MLKFAKNCAYISALGIKNINIILIRDYQGVALTEQHHFLQLSPVAYSNLLQSGENFANI